MHEEPRTPLGRSNRSRPRRALLAGLLAAALVGGATARAEHHPAGVLFDPPPAVAEGARGASAFDGSENHVEARLLSDVSSAAAGETFHLGVLFDLDPGWHLYWRSPGDAGLPTRLDWTVEGAEVGPIEWPTPATFSEGDGLVTTYGYAGRVLLPAEARVSPDARGVIRIDVTARFLACEISCIPGRIDLHDELAVAASGTTPVGEKVAALFEAALAARPVSLESLGLEASVVYSQSAIRPGDGFDAAIQIGCHGRPGCRAPMPAHDALGYAFLPDPLDDVEVEWARTLPDPVAHEGGDFLIALHGSADPVDEPSARRLRGIAALRPHEGAPPVAVELDLPLPRAAAGSEVATIGAPWLADAATTTSAGADTATTRPTAANAAGSAATSPAAPRIGLLRALLFALIGGLILNLMPCVLPVLAIKVFAIAEMAHAHREEVVKQGIAYTVGVVGSMLVLAAAVVALRAGGESIGWGFQFQQPLFVATICAVLVVFALNLFGVFEIFAPTGALAEIGAQTSGARRSFFEGLLAVVLATPCSAPLLGTAVGLAFASPPAVVFAVFGAVGVGLAAPFALVSLVPSWARFIPRAGAWMLTLRSVLGFALLATVVWLLWVVGRLVGSDGLVALLAFLVAVAFSAWVFGRLQQAGRSVAARTAALAALAAAMFGLSQLPLAAPAAGDGPQPAQTGGDHASPYSPAALAAALDAGRPAFVYFTADWCITCKVNEHGTLGDERVRAELARHDFAVLEGDWTRRDEAIRAELARFGKAGVPLYLVYSPAAPDAPRVLPELLTPQLLIDALRTAAHDTEAHDAAARLAEHSPS